MKMILFHIEHHTATVKSPCGVQCERGSFSSFYRFVWDTNSRLASLKEKLLPLNSTVDLWPWEQLILTQLVGSRELSVRSWYFTITVDNRGTDNGSIRVESEKKKHIGRKRPTVAITLSFLIENCFVKKSSQVFYRDSHTNPYFLLAFLHTELGAPVIVFSVPVATSFKWYFV